MKASNNVNVRHISKNKIFHTNSLNSTFCCDIGRAELISSSSEFRRSGGGGGKFSMDPRGVVEFDPSFPDPLVLGSVSTMVNWEFVATWGAGAGGGGGEADCMWVGDVISDDDEVTEDVLRMGGFGLLPYVPPTYQSWKSFTSKHLVH